MGNEEANLCLFADDTILKIQFKKSTRKLLEIIAKYRRSKTQYKHTYTNIHCIFILVTNTWEVENLKHHL